MVIFLLGLAFGFLLPLAGFRLAASGTGFLLPSLGMGLKPPTGLLGPIRVCGMAITSAQGPKETILIRVKNSLIMMFFILISSLYSSLFGISKHVTLFELHN